LTFEEWVASVLEELTRDALWRMRAYQLALFAGDLAWHDTARLVQERRLRALADQLYRAVGSIGGNIAEGYSGRSRKDQARLYEYALGSAREARVWYYQGRHHLTTEVLAHRLGLLTEIIRLLLAMVPSIRGSRLSEEVTLYNSKATRLDDPPLSQPIGRSLLIAAGGNSVQDRLGNTQYAIRDTQSYVTKGDQNGSLSPSPRPQPNGQPRRRPRLLQR
jgi:four helix bundle protein